MTDVPWHIAVVGAGPAGLYAAHEILRRSATAKVDLIDRLPTIGGLVRSGVAPDHYRRRDVIGWYERLVVASGRFSFFGNIDVGQDITVDDLRRSYDAVIFSHGCRLDRRLGIPGEDTLGSHSAAEFVGWYNGHPDYRKRTFDLTGQRAVVIGAGNVALDVARVLLLGAAALRSTDIADHALDALAASNVREVVIVGRRDVEHCAFTTPELMELGDLGIDVSVENAHFPMTSGASSGAGAFATELKCRRLQSLAARPPRGKPRLVLRFGTSPVEILGEHRVQALRLAPNRVSTVAGDQPDESDATVEDVETGLVIRSVGSRGEPLPGLPFDTELGIVPNIAGRVVTLPESHHGAAYVAGWIKRGPSGVIGTNKHCARQTVATMFADLEAGYGNFRRHPVHVGPTGLAGIGKTVIDYSGWRRIDQAEIRAACGSERPRVKITDWQSLYDTGSSGSADSAQPSGTRAT